VPGEAFGDPDAAGSTGCAAVLEKPDDISCCPAPPGHRDWEKAVRKKHSRRECVARGVLEVGDVGALSADGDGEIEVILLQMMAKFVKRREVLPTRTQRHGHGERGRGGGMHVSACDRAPLVSLRVRNRAYLNLLPPAKLGQRIILKTLS